MNETREPLVAVSPRHDSTRRFYETNAQTYAEATRNRVLSPLLADFSARISGGRVLDLGCGAGYDLGAFRSRGHSAFGLDYAEPIARIARTISMAPVVVADMRALPFANSRFDGVWASASLLHLPRGDLVPVLLEARRVLRPGGLLFASLKTGTGHFQDEDGRLFTLFGPENWNGLLTTSGFRPISIASNTGPQPIGGGSPQLWITSLAVSA